MGVGKTNLINSDQSMATTGSDGFTYELETRLYTLEYNGSESPGWCGVQARTIPKDYYSEKEIQHYFALLEGLQQYSLAPILEYIWDAVEDCNPDPSRQREFYACYEAQKIHLPIDKPEGEKFRSTIAHEFGHHVFPEYNGSLHDLYLEAQKDPEKKKLIDAYWYRDGEYHSENYCVKNSHEMHSCMMSIYIMFPKSFRERLRNSSADLQTFGNSLWYFMRNTHFEGQEHPDLTRDDKWKHREISDYFNQGEEIPEACLSNEDFTQFETYQANLWSRLGPTGKEQFIIWAEANAGKISSTIDLVPFLNSQKPKIQLAALNLVIQSYKSKGLSPSEEQKINFITQLKIMLLMPDLKVRALAAEAFSSQATNEDWIDLLHSKKSELRHFAASKWAEQFKNGFLRTDIVCQELRQATQDSNPEVQRAAVQSLGTIGTKVDLKYLKRLKAKVYFRPDWWGSEILKDINQAIDKLS